MTADRPLLIVTGKGGVGRSSVAAAMARVLAGRGRRVLALSMGPGAGLAAHLGVEGIEAVPTRVTDSLWTARIDPAAALHEYVRLRVKVAPLRLAGRLFAALAQTVPGVRDIIVMGKCVHEARAGEWDSVVVDGFPTGQIDSLLLAPTTIQDLVPGGAVHRQAVDLAEFLSDPERTQLVVVSTAEDLAVTETVELLDRVSPAVPSHTVVLNQLLDDPGFASPPDGSGPVAEAARLHLALRTAQQRLAARLPEAARLPFVFDAREPGRVVARLVEELGS